MAVSEKRMTFNREFREARAQFRVNPTEKNFTFTSTVDGGKKTVLKKGETKQSLTKKFKSEGSLNKPAASAKPANSMPGYLKRQATGKKRVVKDDTLADVTKKELTSWKAKNKGRYKGKALTAYLNNKGKNILGASKSDVVLESFVKPNNPSKTKKLDTTGKRITTQQALKFYRDLDPTYEGKINLGDQVILGNVKGEGKIIDVIKIAARKANTPNNIMKAKPGKGAPKITALTTTQKEKLMKKLRIALGKETNRTAASGLITEYNINAAKFDNVPVIPVAKRKQLLDATFKNK